MIHQINLDTVAGIRINEQEESMSIISVDAKKRINTINITDAIIGGASLAGQNPVYRLKNLLDIYNFTLSDGWLFVNQSEVWKAANPDFDK